MFALCANLKYLKNEKVPLNTVFFVFLPTLVLVVVVTSTGGCWSSSSTVVMNEYQLGKYDGAMLFPRYEIALSMHS